MSGLEWSWRVFFIGFWRGYGQFMAAFSALLMVLNLVADTSSASFGSAVLGLFFVNLVSAVYGYSNGDSAVREWRNARGDVSGP